MQEISYLYSLFSYLFAFFFFGFRGERNVYIFSLRIFHRQTSLSYFVYCVNNIVLIAPYVQMHHDLRERSLRVAQYASFMFSFYLFHHFVKIMIPFPLAHCHEKLLFQNRFQKSCFYFQGENYRIQNAKEREQKGNTLTFFFTISYLT